MHDRPIPQPPAVHVVSGAGTAAETLQDVADIIASDTEGFWLLVGEFDDERRADALKNLIVAAWGKGYERGLRRGAVLARSRS